jgi:predicted ribosome quality control (RQC) complex YloA/Tae2 family protein
VHNNYYLFRKLTDVIETRLSEAVVSECFSQSRNELVIRFETKKQPLFMRAIFSPSFACVSFPHDFHRARKNSVDLFPDLVGRKVTGTRQYENERSFAIHLSDDFTMLFKMHGNRSNCLLIEKNVVTTIFNQSIESDLAIDLSRLDRSIDWSQEAFIKNHNRLEAHYFTFGKVAWRYLYENGFRELPLEGQWSAIQELIEQLSNPRYYIVELDKKLTLSLLPFPSLVKDFVSPIEALNYFYSANIQGETFAAEWNEVASRLKSSLRSSENYSRKSEERLLSLQRSNNFKIWADLIMANLHKIDDRSDKVTVENFYDENRLLDIPLKQHLSPQKNAEVYYSKAKKQQVEISILEQSLLKKESEITTLKKQLEELEMIKDLKELRVFSSSIGFRGKSQVSERLPYHEFQFRGFRILVGRNAQDNDTLTLRHSFKEDLWLHAKDVAGSHVLIKYQAGKQIPKDVIERAAQLAAYYSKRKNDTLCPVIVTPKKFVRKRKGDPAGVVVVEKEETILVEPLGI